MAVCKFCLREMLSGESCTFAEMSVVGEMMQRIAYGMPGDRMYIPTSRPCHDCGVRPGGYHHLGCDAEACPRCAGQAFCCECGE